MSKTSSLNWIVTEKESGLKLQLFLKEKIGGGVSARQIKHSIDAGHCQINGKVERFSSRLIGKGDRVTFHKPQPIIPAIPFDSTSRIIYIDNELIIYDKPAGLSSEDSRILSFIQLKSPHAELVHRLDRDTTGVLVFAKNKQIAEAMFELFKQRQIKKTYLAIVDGTPKQQQGVIDNYLGKITIYQGQTIYGEIPKEKGGLRARTAWKLKKAGKEASLIVCYPETGRTHQLRVHLSGMKHPILGDHQYGRSFICEYRPQRLLLHAYEIAFENPVTKQQIKVTANLPSDFIEAESHLDKL